MLTDMIVEEEFEIKQEEPWYDKTDLEHDLHLAAELGKTLLERNRELEQGLQQMYSTNQEQLQEIEYLTKQVDLLRQVNDQHARVYEQLDVSARELEQSNHKLCLDNRAAQQKIQGLTETVEGLQSQVEDLQHHLEELKTCPTQNHRKPHSETLRPQSAQSVSCLKELQNKHRYSDYDVDECSDGLLPTSDLSWREEEQASLRRSLRSLQTQLANERTRREGAEREADMLANENAALEQQLSTLEGCRSRLAEVECEAEELRQLWRADYALSANSMFFNPEEEPGTEEEENDGVVTPVKSPETPKRRNSGRSRTGTPKFLDHERSCVRRSEVVKHRGISLLNEVDAQYSALQVKYDELLRRCHQGELGHGLQPPSHDPTHSPSACPAACSFSLATDKEGSEEDFNQPEYKALFKEIFTCIRKTKEDLSENRAKSLPGGGMHLMQ